MRRRLALFIVAIVLVLASCAAPAAKEAAEPSSAPVSYAPPPAAEPLDIAFMLSREEYDEVILYYEEQLEIDPRQPDIKIELAKVYHMANRTDDAAKQLQEIQAQGLLRPEERHMVRDALYWMMEQPGGWEKLKTVNPEYFEANTSALLVLMAAQLEDEASLDGFLRIVLEKTLAEGTFISDMLLEMDAYFIYFRNSGAAIYDMMWLLRDALAGIPGSEALSELAEYIDQRQAFYTAISRAPAAEPTPSPTSGPTRRPARRTSAPEFIEITPSPAPVHTPFITPYTGQNEFFEMWETTPTPYPWWDDGIPNDGEIYPPEVFFTPPPSAGNNYTPGW